MPATLLSPNVIIHRPLVTGGSEKAKKKEKEEKGLHPNG